MAAQGAMPYLYPAWYAGLADPDPAQRVVTKAKPAKSDINPHNRGGHNNLPSFDEYHNFIRDILKY